MAQQGGEIFLEGFRWVGFKLETYRGVAESLTSPTDYNLLAENVTITTDIKENKRKYAVGTPNRFQSVMGAKAAKITMRLHVKGSGSSSVKPVIASVLQTAGFQYSTTSTHFVLLKKLPGSTASMSFIGREDAASSPTGKQWLLKGCGLAKSDIHVDASGGLMYIDCEFMGVLLPNGVSDIANNALPTADITTEATLPPAALSMTANYGSAPLPIAAFTLSMGNTGALIEYIQDPSGYSFFEITDDDVLFNIAPLIQKENTMAVQADLLTTSVTLRELDIYIGSTTNDMQIVVPKGQIVKGLNWGSRNGIAADTMIIAATQNIVDDTNPYMAIFFPKS